MPLSDSQRVRYARHLLLPELGEEGQLRLLAGSVRFAEGVAREVREVAGEYLRRAGVRVIEDEDEDAHDYAHVDVSASVNGDGDGDSDGDSDVNTTALILSPCSLLCESSLTHAAEALSGAFAAVEVIKRLARIGEPAELDRSLLRAEEV
jgi:hypothetical protein